MIALNTRVCVGRHFLAGFDGYEVTSVVRDLILKQNILGFTLFSWNIESAEQLIALNEELQSLARQARYDLILAVDQEGGRVARLPEPFTTIPPLRACAKLTEAQLFLLGQIVSEEVSLAGFDLDFAPVVDVDLNPKNPIIGDRSFSKDPEEVFRCAKNFIRGFEQNGVLTCLKHFPGHGATTEDSHEGLTKDCRPFSEIESIDLVPYKKLIQEKLAQTIMTAHVTYEAIDPKNPATLSEKIIKNILREDLQFNGVLFSDDFLMKAIRDHYDLTEAAKRFFEIGGDVVLICKEPERTLEILSRLQKEVDPRLQTFLKTSVQRLQGLAHPRKRAVFSNACLSAITKKNQKLISRLSFV